MNTKAQDPDAPLWTLKAIRQRGGSDYRLLLEELKISPGLTAIVGQSGSGKTSLMNLLVGYEQPDEGEVSMCRPFSIFWKPQDDGLWDHVTLRRHLEMCKPEHVTARRVDELLMVFDLKGREKAKPAQLSQGERARLAVARALISGAEVLVMDEALEHVDEARKQDYWCWILQDLKERGVSLVYATHDPDRVLGVADQVICMAEGQVLVQGETTEVYLNPPTPMAMQCLGQGTWMDRQEIQTFLKEDEIDARAFRPHQLEVLPEEQGTLLVRETQQGGMISRTTLEDPDSTAIKQVVHATRHLLKQGDRVNLRLLPGVLKILILAISLGVMMLGLSACGETETEQELKPERTRQWNLPLADQNLPAPRGASIDVEGNAYIIDKAGRVVVFDKEGQYLRFWWMPQYTAGRAESVLVMKDGNIAVADTHYARIVIFTPQGEVIRMFGSEGQGEGQFKYPVGLAQDDDGHLYVSEYGGNDRVQKFTPEGEFIRGFGSFGNGRGQMMRAAGLAWQEGKIYVADAGNNRVSIFTDEGDFVGYLGGKVIVDGASDENKDLSYFNMPFDIETFGGEFCYVIGWKGSRIWRVSLDGKRLGSFGSVGSGLDQTITPWGIAVSPTGDRLLVMDTGNRRVLELTWSLD